MKRIGILTSGGDASGMNAAVRATVRKGLSMGMEVYAIDRGFEGLLDGNIEKMQWHSVGDILQRGGTILRTAKERTVSDRRGTGTCCFCSGYIRNRGGCGDRRRWLFSRRNGAFQKRHSRDGYSGNDR